jgi:hydroxymethylglutaryl-CoA synthase
MNKIGIEKMFVITPSLYIDAKEMAIATGSEEGKIRKGLGINKIRLPGYSEGNITMLADAMYAFATNLMEDRRAYQKFCEEGLGKIFFSTESNPDRSRPELQPAMQLAISKLKEDADLHTERALDIHKIISAFSNSQIVAITYACIGGVNALDSAADYVRANQAGGRKVSAIVITADTSFYDSDKAPNAELTQGAASVLVWVVSSPSLVEIDDGMGSESYNVSLADFTKFGEETPTVNGRLSEIAYVYSIANALENFERRRGNAGNYEFVITHVPFPKQAIYFARFLFAHMLRTKMPDMFKKVEGEIGKDPLENEGFTEYISSLLSSFNKSSNPVKSEKEIADAVVGDPRTNAYWEWLKTLGKSTEFESFVRRLGVEAAIRLPSEIGNSYSSSIFTALASLLIGVRDGSVKQDARGVFIGYGSGSQATAVALHITATKEEIARCVRIKMDDNNPVDAKTYKELHTAHILGDASRTTTSEDLVAKDEVLMKKRPDGFRVVRRLPDGNGEYAYISSGERSELNMRF